MAATLHEVLQYHRRVIMCNEYETQGYRARKLHEDTGKPLCECLRIIQSDDANQATWNGFKVFVEGGEC